MSALNLQPDNTGLYESTDSNSSRSAAAERPEVAASAGALPVALLLPAIPSSVGAVRHTLQELLRGGGADPEAAFGLLVAAGEVMTNAVEHAYRGGAPGSIAIRARTSRGNLIVEIRDQGRWQSAGLRGRGHGLRVASALVDRLDLTPSPHGTMVRLTMRLRPAARRSRTAAEPLPES